MAINLPYSFVPGTLIRSTEVNANFTSFATSTAPQTISADTTWDTPIRIAPGGVITINDGVTLTINGPFEAGLYPVFAGDGQVKGLRNIDAEWFGSDGAALQKAVYAAADKNGTETEETGKGGVVYISSPYTMTTTLHIPQRVSLINKLQNPWAAAISASSSWPDPALPLVQWAEVYGTGAYWGMDSRLENLALNCNLMCNAGLYTNSANENCGATNLQIYKFLKNAVWVDCQYVSPGNTTSPRPMHCTIGPISAVTTRDVPDLNHVIGFKITGVNTFPYFNGVRVQKCTFSIEAGSSATTYAKAGFFTEGLQNVTFTDCHAEYIQYGVIFGETYPAVGCSAINFDGYWTETATIRINSPTAPLSAPSDGNVLLNICNIYRDAYIPLVHDYTKGSPYTLSGATHNPLYISGKVKGNLAFSGDVGTSASYAFSRSQSGTYTPPAGTALLVEHTGALGTAKIVLASNSASVEAGEIVMQAEDGVLTTVLAALADGRIFLGGKEAVRRTSVPATATSEGAYGYYAVDDSYAYFYTGDGTTHKWRRVAISAW